MQVSLPAEARGCTEVVRVLQCGRASRVSKRWVLCMHVKVLPQAGCSARRTFLFPTATEPTLGQGKWGAAPSVVRRPAGALTIGFLANDIWPVGGERYNPVMDQVLLQYFITYNMKKGWSLTDSPIITSNWITSPGNRWFVPFDGSIGKMMKIDNRQLLVWQVNTYYNTIHPRDMPYPEWWRSPHTLVTSVI
jgi:hypothetical protein